MMGLREELLLDAAVVRWRGRLGVAWQTAFCDFSRFYECLKSDPKFAGMSFSEVVEWQSVAVGRDRYYILQLAQDFVNKLGLRYKTKQTFLSHIRSPFMHNQASLPEDRSFHFHSDVAPVEGRLLVEDFKKIVLNSNKMYRAVFLMLAAGLMGSNELLYVNIHLWREVLDGLTKNVGFIKLGLPGRKQNRNVRGFYTLLATNSDWADAMREYLKSSPHELRSCLFRNDHGQPLTRPNIANYFHWRAVETGVIKQVTPDCPKCGGATVRIHVGHIDYKCKVCGFRTRASLIKWGGACTRYGVNPHEIRDLMRSRWRSSGANATVAEFLMGHEVDSNDYDKLVYTPGDAVVEYRKFLPYANAISETPEKVDRSLIDVELDKQRAREEALSQRVVDLESRMKRMQEIMKKEWDQM